MPSTRRTFMAAAAAAPLVQAWQRSPNDRIRLGQIGCGGRSRDHLSELVKSGENADIDAVLIATPDMTHPHILMDAVAAGKDVYVEKPFAVDFHDGKAAWQAVK